MSLPYVALRAAGLDLPAGSVYWITYVADWAADRAAVDVDAIVDAELRAKITSGVRDHHRLTIPESDVTITVVDSAALTAAYDDVVLSDARLFDRARPPWVGECGARIGWWSPPPAP